MFKNKKILIFISVFAVAILAASGYYLYKIYTTHKQVVKTQQQESKGIFVQKGINIETPQKDSTVTFPFQAKGTAQGKWYFESVFPLRLLDKDGKLLATGYAKAQGNWMDPDYVPFVAQFYKLSDGTKAGTYDAKIVFMNDNPSGKPENSVKVEVPLKVVVPESAVPVQPAPQPAPEENTNENTNEVTPEETAPEESPVITPEEPLPAQQ